MTLAVLLSLPFAIRLPACTIFSPCRGIALSIGSQIRRLATTHSCPSVAPPPQSCSYAASPADRPAASLCEAVLCRPVYPYATLLTRARSTLAHAPSTHSCRHTFAFYPRTYARTDSNSKARSRLRTHLHARARSHGAHTLAPAQTISRVPSPVRPRARARSPLRRSAHPSARHHVFTHARTGPVRLTRSRGTIALSSRAA